MSGIEGMKQALKTQNQLINIEASNLTKSQIIGAHEVRATVQSTDPTGKAGPGIAIDATTSDFSQGAINRTGFTTDLAIAGEGFFVLIDAKGEYYYTRRGDFHFDNTGTLVNKDGLYVASFDPKTGELEKTTVEINPITDDLGQAILDELKLQNNRGLTNVQIATALGEPLVDVDAALASLKTAAYVNSVTQGPDTFFYHNLGQLGDNIGFDRDGFVINNTRLKRQGNQIALAKFINNQGLAPSKFGGNIYKSTDAASPSGEPILGAPGDVKNGFGYLESMALEDSTASVPNAMTLLGFLQKNFTSTAAAMKVFLSAIDDLNATVRGA